MVAGIMENMTNLYSSKYICCCGNTRVVKYCISDIKNGLATQQTLAL